MGISIEGVRVKDINLPVDENGVRNPKGSFALISSTGITLATQSFGKESYSSTIDVAYSSETIKLMNEFCKSLTNDVNVSLGLTE